jgi:predicted nucleic acid-binding protein
MSRVFWDTNLFIYLLEDSGDLSRRTSEIRTRMRERGDELLTSALTLGEVLVKPLEAGQAALAARYEDAIVRSATVLAFTRETARRYAEIRRDRTVRAPDAVQLACASQARVDLFITNDDRLTQKTVPGIQFVQSIHRAFL